MDIGEALLAAGEGQRADSFEVFSRSIPDEWIEQALQATGTASIRRRRFPAEYALWTVIGMGLLQDRSIKEVVNHLNLVLPDEKNGSRRTKLTSSAVVQARDRLGAQPLEALFHQTAAVWASNSADQHRWRGLAVYGVDGTSLRIADTPDNEQAFGRPGSGRAPSAYPQLRLVALMVLRSHLLAGLSIGHWRDSETTLAKPLWEQLPERSLTVFDRGFVSYSAFLRIQTGAPERHWLTRTKKNIKWDVVKSLGANDDIVEITVSRPTRRDHPELPEKITVRAVRYRRRGFQPQVLLTSLLDAKAYPRKEIVKLYHERWEIELGFDEIKTHTLERLEALRSRAPERVIQEVWGLALGYNLVRLEMERAAKRIGVPPPRISYRLALMLIRGLWGTGWIASSGAMPKRLKSMQEEIELCVLPPRRPRRYPRAVKLKTTRYPRKR